MFYSPCVNWKWLLCVTFYIPFPNIYVCIETQDANCLFWNYLEEESAGHDTSGLPGEARGGRPGRFASSTISFRLIAQTPWVWVCKSVSSALYESRQTQCLEVKIKKKLTWKFYAENVRHQGYFGPSKNSAPTTHWAWRWCLLSEAKHGSALVRRALYPQAVTSSENEMSDVGHSQHFVHAKQ